MCSSKMTTNPTIQEQTMLSSFLVLDLILCMDLPIPNETSGLKPFKYKIVFLLHRRRFSRNEVFHNKSSPFFNDYSTGFFSFCRCTPGGLKTFHIFFNSRNRVFDEIRSTHTQDTIFLF